MPNQSLSYIHLATVLLAFLIGTFILLSPKGTPRHRTLGKIFMVLMLSTAVLVLFIPARQPPMVFGYFGRNHLFVIPVAYFVPSAYFAAKRGDIRTHKANILGVYCGAIILAGIFAFAPGRLLHTWLFG
jgi:uncharacterized membrane protein